MWGTKIKALPFKLVVQSEIEIWRAADFWTKEPETIAWIDSFEPNSVFWDIGANIGVFSLYAATKDIELVKSFEPDNNNYKRIRDNIIANEDGVRSVVDGYYDVQPIALSDFDGKSTFYVHRSGAGSSGGQVGESKSENGQPFKPEESYEVETYKIDTLAKRFGTPHYIKIDVDGQEVQILKGGYQTLGKPEVRGVLVEINNNHDLIENYMIDLGFTGFNKFNGADINRRVGQKSYNRIYTRT